MRFYTSVTNSRGKLVNAGSHKGQSAHIRGWNKGVRVESYIDENGKDRFKIYETSGSNGKEQDILINEF